jgi:cytochrome c oxidase subunit IV
MTKSPLAIDAVILAVVLLLGMLLMLEIGRRLGLRRRRSDDGAGLQTGVVDGAVFALFGLLVAFTFSGAAARFDARRALVVQEANAIGTAYLRLDLLPEDAQSALRDLFRTYLDSRLETYRRIPDLVAVEAELAHSLTLQAEIWKRALAACRQGGSQPAVTSLVVSSLNEMFDIVTTRTAAAKMHPPVLVFALLYVLGLGCSLVAGFGLSGTKKRSWIHMLGFTLVTAMTVYVILDMEFPRIGLIRVDRVDEVLVALRQSMR